MADSQKINTNWSSTRCVCTTVRRADRALNRIYDEALHPSGLLTTQYSLLATLARADKPLLHGELADAQVMASTTLTRNLAPLIRDGLVRVEPGKDKRTRYVSITDKGLAARERARPLWLEAQERIRKSVGDERVSELLNELADLVSRIR